MIHMFYAIRDKKVACYDDRLFAYRTDAEAMRAMSTAMQTGKGMLSNHPEDYSLWHMFSMDDESGKVQQGQDMPRHVCDAIQLKKYDQIVKEKEQNE